MADILLTIQRGNTIFTPPVEEGIKIEWELTGSPGKMTFTTIKPSVGDMSFFEGDPVCLYYNQKLVFQGFVFKKKRDREGKIQVTCYDQIRYLKNKYTYVYENKRADEIVKAMCNDFGLQLGGFDNTQYKLPEVAEENTSALDIICDVLDETLRLTGKRFVFYDEGGKLVIRNAENMISTTLIVKDTAENFDYSSSIDDETYNQVVLYYTGDDGMELYTASSPSTIKQWGTLRYFEDVDTRSEGEAKARSLLKLFNRKTRELKITGAFGDITVRGGTLIPVNLDLGDVITKNYMLVEKVTHIFNHCQHTMDLTLSGAWDDGEHEVVSETKSYIVETPTKTEEVPVVETGNYYSVAIECNGADKYAGQFYIYYTKDGAMCNVSPTSEATTIYCDKNSKVEVHITQPKGSIWTFYTNYFTGLTKNRWRHNTMNNAISKKSYATHEIYTLEQITDNCGFRINWINGYTSEIRLNTILSYNPIYGDIGIKYYYEGKETYRYIKFRDGATDRFWCDSNKPLVIYHPNDPDPKNNSIIIVRSSNDDSPIYQDNYGAWTCVPTEFQSVDLTISNNPNYHNGPIDLCPKCDNQLKTVNGKLVCSNPQCDYEY